MTSSEPEHDDFLDGFLSSAFAGETTGLEPELVLEEDVPESLGRFRVIERIGLGGVGIVYRVEDPELGRDVAIKVLREPHADDPRFVARFREEARVCGRLTHPGVVTVHEIGELEDGRPYFAMKLIDGDTLAQRLRGRAPGRMSSELLEVFERVAQTAAYAHDRGVVHGDLKPHNVMVGAFGEVQVMDWGFALESSGGATSAPDQGGDDKLGSKGGGTPAYMAPEQAAQSKLEITARTDVFGLGAILCELITHAPPYLGETRAEVLLRATRGWQDDLQQRLDAADADHEIVALARRCLAPDPEHRPAHAGEVADELAVLRAAREDRSHRLEIEAAEARATAGQERRARRLTLALSSTIAAAVLVVAITLVWMQSDAAARTLEAQRNVEESLAAAASAENAARAGFGQELAHWRDAIAAAERAVAFAQSRDASADLRERAATRLAEIQAESERTERELALASELQELRPHLGDERSPEQLDRSYEAAFSSAGIDLGMPVDNLVSRIDDSRRRETILGALDQWALFRRRHRVADWEALHRLALAADDDPWRDRLREAFQRGDRSTLRSLARDLDPTQHSASSLDLLAATFVALGERSEAIDVYRKAIVAHPADYQLVHNLATQLELLETPPLEEITRWCWVGVALRPDDAHALTDLGLALLSQSRHEDALPFLERAAEIAGAHPRTHLLLGAAYQNLEKFDQAIESFHIAGQGGIAAGWFGRSTIAVELGRFNVAIESLRAAVEADPRDYENKFQLGRVLCLAGHPVEGIEVLQACVEARPDHAEAWCNLGNALVSRGAFVRALEVLRRGHALGEARGPDNPWPYASDIWVQRASFLAQTHVEYVRYFEGGGTADDVPNQDVMPFAMVATRVGDCRHAVDLYSRVHAVGLDAAPTDEAFALFDVAECARDLVLQGGALDGGADVHTVRTKAIDWLESWIELTSRIVADGKVPKAALALGVHKFLTHADWASFGAGLPAGSDLSDRFAALVEEASALAEAGR